MRRFPAAAFAPMPRAAVHDPFDWTGVHCEWNQDFCKADSVALVETGATVMNAKQAPAGLRAPRHLCRKHLQAFARVRSFTVIQRRPAR